MFGAMTVTWDAERGGETSLRAGDRAPSSEFGRSPFAVMLATGEARARYRLDDPELRGRFEILDVLATRGFTDYVARVVPFGAAQEAGQPADGLVVSWATRRPAGFSDREVSALHWLTTPLALALRVDISLQIASTALRTYHGTAAGDRILAGTIQRGSGERIETAIWYSDLRRSTALADSMDVDSFLALLNAYFDCTAGAVLEAGGQVLELIGDAVLAIFPVTQGVTRGDACAAALAAARAAERRLFSLGIEQPGLAGSIRFGIGINFGTVVFGNVGTADRLSFGLVGSAVSETARIETLTKTLGHPVLIGDKVAENLGEPLLDLGHHVLRGVEHPRRLWALHR
jgi:adenylate cyclase